MFLHDRTGSSAAPNPPFYNPKQWFLQSKTVFTVLFLKYFYKTRAILRFRNHREIESLWSMGILGNMEATELPMYYRVSIVHRNSMASMRSIGSIKPRSSRLSLLFVFNNSNR